MARTHALTPAQLRELRAHLESDFARVSRITANADQGSVLWSTDMWSPARGSTSVQLEAVLQDSARDRMAAISAALRRLDDGSYGACAACGDPISFGRLSVMPETTLCVTCGSM